MPTNTEEKETIRQLIMDYYHEGHVKADPALYEHVLHDEWKMFLLDEDGGLRIVAKEEYYSWYKPDEADDSLEWETKIETIDVFQNNAAVKLWIGNQEYGYVDYFNMMKIERKWWIVHKISQRADGGPPGA